MLSLYLHMISFANAKINIGLYITEKRSDGYHNIETVFYPFPLYDIIEIRQMEEGATQLEITGIDLPVTADNLCLKAFNLLQADFNLPAVHIHLHKQIPFGAGLGGGSADAAEVLKLLNNLFNLGISSGDLQQYAKQLGADCPFFIENKAVFAAGIGTEFTAIELDLSSYYVVLLKPDLHISTQEAYQGVQAKQANIDLKQVLALPVAKWKSLVKNDFEIGLFEKYPQLEAIKLALYEQGAEYAAMSGSGSTLYGIFKEKVDLSCLSIYGSVIYPVEL